MQLYLFKAVINKIIRIKTLVNLSVSPVNHYPDTESDSENEA